MNFILRNENAIRYECGYGCDNAVYIKLGSEAFFITDGRYAEEAQKKIHNAQVHVESDLIRKAVEILRSGRVKKCRLDPKEWDIYSFSRLKKHLKTKWVKRPDLSHLRRIIKNTNEIRMLRKASRAGAKAFDEIAQMLSNKGIGLSELEINFMAEKILRASGRRELSFKPITAISANASRPHAVPGGKKLKAGSLFLLDAGVKYRGYCSDRTRTAFVSEKISFGYDQAFSSKKIQKAYDIVLKAHDAAIAAVSEGVKASDIDKVARSVIEKAGYGEYFVHSTGHGVGLDIHEMPYISRRSDTVIEEGMVFTIEPGIYIPGRFGIRIEDTVAVIGGRAVVI